jgi:chromosomal replication initiation ATPase DnaA
MYVAHKKYDYQLIEIATALQLKHYGGVAHAIAVITKQFKIMPELIFKINSIIKRLDP